MTDYSVEGTGQTFGLYQQQKNPDWRTRTTDASEYLTKIMTWPNPVFETPQIPRVYDDSVRAGREALAQYLANHPGPWVLPGYSQWDEQNGYQSWSVFDDPLAEARSVFDDLCRDLNGRVIVPMSDADRYDLPYDRQEDRSEENRVTQDRD